MYINLEAIATKEGKSPQEIRNAIQEVINAAWTSNNPQHRQAQKKLTGSHTAPTPEELIAAIAREVQKRLS